jgi:hypothetical protein
MASHRRDPEPVGQAEPLRGMLALLVVVLAAWALSLLPGAWGLLAFVPVTALAVAVVAPLLIKRWRVHTAPPEQEEEAR